MNICDVFFVYRSFYASRNISHTVERLALPSVQIPDGNISEDDFDNGEDSDKDLELESETAE